MNNKQRVVYGACAVLAILMIIGLGSVYAKNHQSTVIIGGHTVADPAPTTPSGSYTGEGIADPVVPDPPAIDDPRDEVANDPVTQSYYYCWDTGAAKPHHLGYPVPNDHLCTNSELHDAGYAGY